MKLWDKGSQSDSVMHEVTVGDDPLYDALLYRWDCIGSAAQVKVLVRAKILSKEEGIKLLTALNELKAQCDTSGVTIPRELEDVHTTIENSLVALLGDIGKKIHTGRSRNDQVITATRLFLRSTLLTSLSHLVEIFTLFHDRYNELKDIPLPGYTHLQRAMPSSIGMWLHAFMEGTLECIRDGVSLLDSCDMNPLGAGAGFGSSLPLDREYSARVLGFRRAQRSFIDIQNSRGRYEERFLFWCCQIGGIVEKFAWDVELYLTSEFGFFSLPESLTTGSSIMPQKKNPDIIELLRARCSMLRGYLAQLQWVTGKLPSNYHRDFQLSKAPFFNGTKEVSNIFQTLKLVIPNFAVDKERLNYSMDDSLYATYEAYRLVKKGTPFRDAYKSTAQKVGSNEIQRENYREEEALLKKEVHAYVEESRKEFEIIKEKVSEIANQVKKAEEGIFSPHFPE